MGRPRECMDLSAGGALLVLEELDGEDRGVIGLLPGAGGDVRAVRVGQQQDLPAAQAVRDVHVAGAIGVQPEREQGVPAVVRRERGHAGPLEVVGRCYARLSTVATVPRSVSLELLLTKLHSPGVPA